MYFVLFVAIIIPGFADGVLEPGMHQAGRSVKPEFDRFELTAPR